MPILRKRRAWTRLPDLLRAACSIAAAVACTGLVWLADPASAVVPALAAAPTPTICDSLYAPGWKPLEGRIVSPRSSPPRPTKGLPVRDPVHGTCIVRVTEHDKEPPKGFARNNYSRRQAFNADNTRFIVDAQDGFWHLYDASTFAHLEQLNGLSGDAEPQWDGLDPDRLYYLPREGVGMKLHVLNVRTGLSDTVADFGPRIRARWPLANAVWTKSEGSPSADGRYWCFMVDDAQWKGLGVVTWDRQEDKFLGMLDLHGQRPDHVSMSPGGGYCVVSGTTIDTLVYDRDLTHPRLLLKGTEHSDLAIDAQGDDVYVAIDYESPGGQVFMTNLRTGRRTDLFPTYLEGTTTALHISGKAYDARGWVLVSTYAEGIARGKPGPQWLQGRLFAVSLQASPRIVLLAHHQSQFAKYWTEPQASTNRDMTRILFNSNWGTKSETDVDAYMLILPRTMPWSRH